MRKSYLKHISFFLAAMVFITAATACNMPRTEQEPSGTLSVTQAYQTVEARLTQAAETNPADTPLPSAQMTPTPTFTQATATLTLTPAQPTLVPSSPTPVKLCDVASPGNPIDVTIPDDSTMLPGQSFTKVWRLQNTGTCVWSSSYAVTFFSGEQMSAPASVALSGEVRPGQSVDISVDMVAPLAAGKHQSNWKLRNAANVLFGIGPNGSAPFWVRIVVVQTATPSVSPATPTVTVTTTPTPPARVSGSSTLVVNNSLDLDTNQLISGAGGDIAYQSNDAGEHILVPQGSALIGVYGGSQPGRANCQAAALSNSPLTVDGLATGTYLCYQTDQGLPGWARVSAFNIDNFNLTLEIYTWNLP
jgi:hypothetical protein